MTPAEEMTRLGARAKEAARAIAKAHPDAKSQALLGLAELLQERQAVILAANAQDLAAARAAGQELLAKAGATAVSLGDGVLRTSSAGVVSLAQLQVLAARQAG